jgi:hypothetical protein
MEQRALRLGDLVDDYCPRERRVTNHAIVAIVNESIRQTRCTACDTEHVFKGGKAPRRRMKDQPVDNTGGQLVLPARVEDDRPAENASVEIIAAVEMAAVEVSVQPAEHGAAEPDGNGERHDESWPANRQLIRATLPRVEGEQPPPRPIPEFTMHQRYSGRGAGAYRQARSWAEQGFGSARGNGNGNGNANGNGNGNVARGDRRQGQGHGQGSGFPGQGQGGRRRHGKKRPR